MNWLTDIVRPRIRFGGGQRDVPENIWTRCGNCGAMLLRRELDANDDVCPHCDHHMRMGAVARLKLLFDDAQYTEITVPEPPQDPLRFRDRKRYTDRLRADQAKTGRQDAIIVAEGTVGGSPAVLAAFDFDFMGGSMGIAVGNGIVEAARVAADRRCALLVIPASGGARMQEGILSLMQMPRSIAAIQRVKDMGLPYVVILTDPTTGGVSASFAMLGDIHIAEKGAQIAFAGARVIEETVKESLPEGFQRAEFLYDRGMVDLVVPRNELKGKLAAILDLLGRRRLSTEPAVAEPTLAPVTTENTPTLEADSDIAPAATAS
jgi:acetyl-CoA carboxylase carboxyl transferase subunit beta